MTSAHQFVNPFRPGAGHTPPYLAGRKSETGEFLRLLKQKIILENLVLTGLRGVGKTVLLDTFKPLAFQNGWGWVGTDLSESASISEDHLAIRLMTDLAVITSSLVIDRRESTGLGFSPQRKQIERRLDFDTLMMVYQRTPGLVADKLKAILEMVWARMKKENKRGIIFAYDEAQNLSDHAEKEQYPLSLLLDVFQSIQKREIPFMLALSGLPTLFPKLVEARTYAERMFHVVFLDRLNEEESRDAILKPLEQADRYFLDPFRICQSDWIVSESGGYPYFIQFICREIVDAYLQAVEDGQSEYHAYPKEIIRKLDIDFFAGRWSRVTDRQRELLTVVAGLETAEGEFTVQEVAEESKKRPTKPFTPSHISQMFAALCNIGLLYKNRHGKYSFAVPLLGRFIRRQSVSPQSTLL